MTFLKNRLDCLTLACIAWQFKQFLSINLSASPQSGEAALTSGFSVVSLPVSSRHWRSLFPLRRLARSNCLKTAKLPRLVSLWTSTCVVQFGSFPLYGTNQKCYTEQCYTEQPSLKELIVGFSKHGPGVRIYYRFYFRGLSPKRLCLFWASDKCNVFDNS